MVKTLTAMTGVTYLATLIAVIEDQILLSSILIVVATIFNMILWKVEK